MKDVYSDPAEESFAEYVKLNLTMPVKITLNELIDMLSLTVDDRAMFIAIAAIDEAVADWNFTEQCFEHFKKLMEEHDRE